ncbi:MAG: ATP synthase F0 subunit B [Bacteroidetes bacterium]|nr:MAG: ATP synthase F0 subunit B [Bacteroidota bacterium]RLD82181.1 MAG: ATP synthase F0 subunit B [Bacteroidota bacterium]
MEIVSPGIGLILWMTVSFVALVFILRRYAWKPILKSLHDREETIDEALNQANKAREEMKNLKSDNEKLLKEAQEERAGMLRDARKVKESIIEQAKTKANEEANNIVENAKERIENEKMAAMTDLKNQIASISIEVAEKVLERELAAENKQEAYLKKLIENTKFN